MAWVSCWGKSKVKECMAGRRDNFERLVVKEAKRAAVVAAKGAKAVAKRAPACKQVLNEIEEMEELVGGSEQEEAVKSRGRVATSRWQRSSVGMGSHVLADGFFLTC